MSALVLLACDRTQVREDDTTAATGVSRATQSNNARTDANPLPPGETAPGANVGDGNPRPILPKLTPEAERGIDGARNMLLSFARAIEQKEYGHAWSLLSPDDKRKWSRAEFAAIFADLGDVSIAIPTGSMEGAAGSSFYTAPITVTGNDKAGRPVRIEGKAVLRRVNDVDGSTLEQRRWHFQMLTLDWTH